MTYIKESIYDTYFVKKIPKDWNEVNVRCKIEKNKDKIFCQLISYKQRFLEQDIPIKPTIRILSISPSFRYIYLPMHRSVFYLLVKYNIRGLFG